MADLRHILDSFLELQAAKSRVQDGSAARRTVMLLSWKRNAMSIQNFPSWVCATSLCKICLLLGNYSQAAELALHHFLSESSDLCRAIIQGTVVMKHGVQLIKNMISADSDNCWESCWADTLTHTFCPGWP